MPESNIAAPAGHAVKTCWIPQTRLHGFAGCNAPGGGNAGCAAVDYWQVSLIPHATISNVIMGAASSVATHLQLVRCHPVKWACHLAALISASIGFAAPLPAADSAAADHFEKRVRPLLIERCHKCHAGEKVKGNLHLDSALGLRQGGKSGPVVVAGKPEESRLVQAVRHEGGLKMPPDGKLSESQIADLLAWVKAGAVFPEANPTAASAPVMPVVIAPKVPNAEGLAPHLQLWLKGDDLALKDSDPVFLWPDKSGHGRDLSATRGVRADGVG